MRTLLCAALLATATLAAPAPARAGNLIDLAVVDRDTGSTLPTWSRHGKLYIAGTPGHRYAVRMSNRSGGRVLAVLSVDGVNAVSGETADTNQAGYVLDAHETTEIAGWRKSLDEIAQFNFTALPESYAAQTGRPANVGVIGVAVFTERAPAWRGRDEIAREKSMPPPPVAPAAADAESRADSSVGAADSTAGGTRLSPQAAPAAKSAREERLGTGHGEREYARVDTTTFQRASRRPAETVAIWYDSYRNLVAQGVIRTPKRPHEPQPFPNAFVPDPPRR